MPKKISQLVVVGGRVVRRVGAVAVVVGGSVVAASAQTSTDVQDIIDGAQGKYGTAVAIYIAAAVIGAAILYIRKGLRGRM